MSPRNLLILFFSTVAVSLVILIIFFSLFFKNIDLDFNTRLPESAPDLGKLYEKPEPSAAERLYRSTINVPPEFRGAPADKPVDEPEEESSEQAEQENSEDVSDDNILDNPAPAPAAQPASGPSKPETPAPSPVEERVAYQVYMGGFANREEAEAAAAKAVAAGVSPLIKQNGGQYVVQLGSFSNKENADSLAARTGAQVRKAN